jgi:hypothetical protein
LNPEVADDLVRPTMVYSYKVLPTQVEKPALVMFTYRKGNNMHEEPVYNIDVANIDDAPIVRAHDLGPERDRALIEYYAKKQPQRHVYRFDRGTGVLEYYGTAGALAKQFAAGGATTAPATAPATAPVNP